MQEINHEVQLPLAQTYEKVNYSLFALIEGLLAKVFELILPGGNYLVFFKKWGK